MPKWVQNSGGWISEQEVLKNITNPKLLRCSQLFWWIAYLRLSEDYWWCCQQRGDTQDLQLQNIYQRFGDIYAFDRLDQWWAVNAQRLFGQMETHCRSGDPVIVVQSADLTHQLDLGGLIVRIPDGLSTDSALVQLKLLLDKNLVSKRLGRQSPLFQLLDYPTKSRRRLLTAYQTWCLSKLVRQSHDCRWRLYEIGVSLRLSPRNLPDKTDSQQRARFKQSCTRVTTQQNLADAALLIANVELGRFPGKAAVTATPRWSVAQQRDLEAARRDCLRFRPDWLVREFEFLDPLQQRRLAVDRQTTVADGVAILTEYANMDFPFMASQKAARAGRHSASLAVNPAW